MEIPAGFGNVTFRYKLTGDDEEKTFSLGYRNPAGVSEGQLASAAGIMTADYITTFHTGATPPETMLVPWEFVGIRAKFNAGGTMHELEAETPIIGVAVGAAPVVNTALLVRKKTGLAGRTNRGRMYVPFYGFDESGLDTYGNMDSGDLDILQDLWDDFHQLSVTGGDWTPVLLHADGSVEAPDDITNFQVMPKAATQRRRMR